MTTSAGYHHGDLPTALKAATVELVAERGATGFSLREVARRAGVTHAAPAHHFGDSRGLLTAVAIEGFTMLNDAFALALAGEQAVGGDSRRRLIALGQAYIRIAHNHGGHFTVMWSEDLIDLDDPVFVDVSQRAYGYLERCLVEVAKEHNPELDIEGASLLTWSSVHGLAMLYCSPSVNAELRPSGELDAWIVKFADLLLDGFTRRPEGS
ncbi:MAG: TetR/AcrR family transcriptional regulator [Acidimicrobiia bacterium]|nr:TetR/AcrR family transcriptional regulator [Acidimicrobiia bacterium]